MEMTMCFVPRPLSLPTLHSNNKTGKTGKTNKTKVSSYFGLFFSFIYFLLASFFYLFMLNHRSGRERGGGEAGGATHMCPSLSGPISLAAGQFETCAKRQEEGQLSVPPPPPSLLLSCPACCLLLGFVIC